jgi:hypothetical protein
MSKRRVNFGAITSEAARRQLMLPVTCWEKKWIVPENSAQGSSLRVLKWVKTDKIQVHVPVTFGVTQISVLICPQLFNEDEEDADQPLAPLQDVDDVEVIDDDMDQDEPANSSRAVSEPVLMKDSEAPSKATTPKPHPLSVSFQPPTPPPLPQEAAEDPQTLTATLGAGLDEGAGLDPDDIMNLDMSQLGPDGEPFGGNDTLLEVQVEDVILGGSELMDHTEDPFAPPSLPQNE